MWCHVCVPRQMNPREEHPSTHAIVEQNLWALLQFMAKEDQRKEHAFRYCSFFSDGLISDQTA